MLATEPLTTRMAKDPGKATVPAGSSSFLLVFSVQLIEVKKGKIGISFLPQDDNRREFRIGLDDHRAQFGPGSLNSMAAPEKSMREGGAPHQAGNFAIENLMGVDRLFTMQAIVKASDKLGWSVIDAEITG